MNGLFPRWLRVIWWIAMLVGLGTFLVAIRGASIAAGSATVLDTVAFLGWFGLLLSPLFSEVKLFGLALKSEVAKLREEVSRELGAIRQEVRVGLDVRNTFSPTFVNYPGPATEPKLKELEENLARTDGPSVRASTQATPEPSGSAIEMFKWRYALEQEVDRIVRERELDVRTVRGTSLPAKIRIINQAELLPRQFAEAAREMFLITSRAIHGEPVSEGQIEFVRDVAPRLLTTLRTL